MQTTQQQPRGRVRGNITSRRQRHPLRHKRSRAVGLSDHEEVLGAMLGSAEHLDLMASPRMERIVDADQLYELFAGTM
jgi:hypothetical protein